MERAKLYNIRFNLCVDLKDFSFMKDIDMVTILGHSIDNTAWVKYPAPWGAIPKIPSESEICSDWGLCREILYPFFQFLVFLEIHLIDFTMLMI